MCSPRTFLRWLRAAENRNATVSAAPTRILGRPRTPDDLRELVLRIAKETGWGYTRIMGELRRLGIAVSRSTVKNILRQAGLEPGPQRGPGSWSEFLKIHAETLWQCDFFSTQAWTPRGLVECFALVFIHVGSRRVWVSPITAHPDGPWVERQARRFAEAEPAPEKAVVFHDRDTKFTTEFRAALKVGGFTPSKLPIRSPNLNCYVERWVQSIKQEALEPFIILGARHLNHLVAEYVEYFNDHRAHSSLHFRTPTTRGKSFPERPPSDTEPILRHQRLGGVLNWYERPSRAA